MRRPGITLIIVLALFASAGLRLGSHSEALAKETGLMDTPDPSEIETQETLTCPEPEAPRSLLQALKERESDLDARENRLTDRMKALEIAENRLATQEQALIKAEEQLAATLSIADEAAENDLKKLTSVYESMKPKNAAALFAEMAPEFAAGFLGRMRSDSAAAVMASLSPEKAYKISIILAGRNAAAPKD